MTYIIGPKMIHIYDKIDKSKKMMGRLLIICHYYNINSALYLCWVLRMNFRISIPLIIAVYATCVIYRLISLSMFLIQTCELCIIQRYPYFSLFYPVLHYLLKSKNPNQPSHFLLKRAYAGPMLLFYLPPYRFFFATYHFGIENNYWQNFSDALIDYQVLSLTQQIYLKI